MVTRTFQITLKESLSSNVFIRTHFALKYSAHDITAECLDITDKIHDTNTVKRHLCCWQQNEVKSSNARE